MSTRTTEDLTQNLKDYLQTIDHLPEGARLIFHHTSWDDYERLLEALAETRHFRVSYDSGRLEIMSPLRKHERYAKMMERLVYFVADKLDLEVESYGIATWKKAVLGRGVEADACFYIGDLARIAEHEDIESESVPPPDIAVEIDLTGDSQRKFPIYAALGVPEIWRYDGKDLYFYQLVGHRYHKIYQSRFITGLRPVYFAEPLEQVKTKTQPAVMGAFAKRWRSLKIRFA
jgi:Uma2 family endonuclease